VSAAGARRRVSTRPRVLSRAELARPTKEIDMHIPTPTTRVRNGPAPRRFTNLLAATSLLVVIALAGCGGSRGGSSPAAVGSAPAANGAAPSTGSHSVPPSAAARESSNIPQGNGGDGDGDNNGAPSDGDGDV
jgi:hypothetical protein